MKVTKVSTNIKEIILLESLFFSFIYFKLCHICVENFIGWAAELRLVGSVWVCCFCWGNRPGGTHVSFLSIHWQKLFPNQKPWFNGKVKTLLRTQDSGFKSGDLQAYKQARQNLRRGINEAKCMYKQRIEEHLNSNNSRSRWQGIKTLTSYKDSYTADNSTDRTLPVSFNHLFSRFHCQIAADTSNTTREGQSHSAGPTWGQIHPA